jgi:hypothetical protein
MSANNAIIVRKLSENEFQIRDVCVDNYGEKDPITGEPDDGFLITTRTNLEDAMKFATQQYSEYGISYEDRTEAEKK